MPRKSKQQPRAWFETFFTGLALDFWRSALPPEFTKAEVDFIEAELSSTTSRRQARWLDVPCGHGRHAIELARRGHSVLGIDFSSEEIDEAKRRAKGVSGLTFRKGDMRNLRLDGKFTGAYCFGNSFGYLELPDMKRFIRSVFVALKPGARFLVNTGMAAESILPRQGYFNQRESHQIGDMIVVAENRYLPEESCVETDIIFTRGAKKEDRMDHHYVYTVAELKRLLTEAGFQIINIFGSLDRKPFALGSENLFIVTGKP